MLDLLLAFLKENLKTVLLHLVMESISVEWEMMEKVGQSYVLLDTAGLFNKIFF